ncbi:MAG: cation transporter [Thermoanaerobaculales bacterium]
MTDREANPDRGTGVRDETSADSGAHLRPAGMAPREAWVRWARALAWVTVGYNLLEGLVSMGFGAADESLALFGFGADSFIEVGSALLVLWRFRHEANPAASAQDSRERFALRGIGALFVSLALVTAAGSVWQLAARRHPDTALPGLVIALASLSFMILLWREKRRAALALDSRAAAGDAACSLACVKLSLVLLAGSALFLVAPALWWADAAAAVGLAAMISRDGWELLGAAHRIGADGCCGC